MDQETTNNAPGPEGNAAPAEASQAPAPTKAEPSAKEKALQTKLDKATAAVKEAAGQRDEYQRLYEQTGKDLRQVEAERDDYKAKYDAAVKPSTPPTGPEASTEPAEVNPHAETKELLQRFKLPCAYLLPDGTPCFDEKHARHIAGDEFDTLTKISAE